MRALTVAAVLAGLAGGAGAENVTVEPQPPPQRAPGWVTIEPLAPPERPPGWVSPEERAAEKIALDRERAAADKAAIEAAIEAAGAQFIATPGETSLRPQDVFFFHEVVTAAGYLCPAIKRAWDGGLAPRGYLLKLQCGPDGRAGVHPRLRYQVLVLAGPHTGPLGFEVLPLE